MSDLGRLMLLVSEPPFGIGRAEIKRLCALVASAVPSRELDAELLQLLDPFGGSQFLTVERSLQYRVEGRPPYREDDNICLFSRSESTPSVPVQKSEISGTGDSADFWDEWFIVPPYTSNYATAVALKSHILGYGHTASLDEHEELVRESDDEERVVRTFRAKIRDLEGGEIIGPVTTSGATAVLAATLKFLLDATDGQVLYSMES